MASQIDLMQLKDGVEADLLAIDGVEGVGIGPVKDGTDELALIIYTSVEKIAAIPNVMEVEVTGETVKVVQIFSGEFWANGALNHPAFDADGILAQEATANEFRKRIRPVPGGYSVGHNQIIHAGSSGCVFAIEKNQRVIPLLFSNAHVLNHNNSAPPWWTVVQPGRIDGGHATNDKVGNLAIAWKILSDQANIVDCGIAKADSLDSFSGAYPDRGYLRFIWKWFNYGNTDCYKVGRTTGRVTGGVESWYVTTRVNYGNWGGLGIVTFKYTTLVKSDDPISLPGDSGSVWVQPVDSGEWGYAGMNFAGPADGRRSISFALAPVQDWFKKNGIPLKIWREKQAHALDADPNTYEVEPPDIEIPEILLSELLEIKSGE